MNERMREMAELACAGIASAFEWALNREVTEVELLDKMLGTPIDKQDHERGKRLFAALVADGRFPPVKDE